MKSPLRYPGGKTRAVKILKKYVNSHFPGRKVILSPFFGGGSFEIAMKEEKYKIFANDLFVPLYRFWTVLKNNPTHLTSLVRDQMPVSKEKFSEIRQDIMDSETYEEMAASYYIINRCSFSGSTFCGGYSAQAATGRLNDSSLRTLATSDLKDVEFSNMDCCAFLNAHPEKADTLVYADPPYYIKTYIYGKDGDMHESFDHAAFAYTIKKRKDWIISYNDCEYIRELYKGCRIFTESWAYGMNASKESSEVIILPPL
jgi:DNA adenine methylase